MSISAGLCNSLIINSIQHSLAKWKIIIKYAVFHHVKHDSTLFCCCHLCQFNSVCIANLVNQTGINVHSHIDVSVFNSQCQLCGFFQYIKFDHVCILNASTIDKAFICLPVGICCTCNNRSTIYIIRSARYCIRHGSAGSSRKSIRAVIIGCFACDRHFTYNVVKCTGSSCI